MRYPGAWLSHGRVNALNDLAGTEPASICLSNSHFYRNRCTAKPTSAQAINT